MQGFFFRMRGIESRELREMRWIWRGTVVMLPVMVIFFQSYKVIIFTLT